MIRKLLIAISAAIVGAFTGGIVGLAIANHYIFRAADASHLSGCGNVGMDPGMVIGLAVGTVAGIWIAWGKH